MKSFTLLILFTLLSLSSFSIPKKCYHYVPYWRSLNPEKLALRLTNNLASDSEKICAIHGWMTHHIKYDIKKYLAYDYSQVSTKKILKKRKAICTGYSNLFNELCKYAQVKSTAIPGYTKNENVDLNDKFYLDEHIWNAVYLNKDWKLLDVCWDAGYISYTKRTFWGFIIHTLTLGRRDIYKYHPHFVKSPSEAYYLKSGNYFFTDHIPADPIWQMIDPVKSIVNAELDSSYYLRRRTDLLLPFSDYLDGQRGMVSNLTPEEREINDGFSSYRFNHKNQYGIGHSYYLLANKVDIEINPKSKDTVTLLKQCDSVNFKVNKAIIRFDSTIFFLSIQKDELVKNNIKKYTIMMNEYASLMASTRVAARNIRTGKRLAISGHSLSKIIIRVSNRQLKTLRKSKKFSNAKAPKKEKPQEAAVADAKVSLLLDSIADLEKVITFRFQNLDTIHKACMNRLNSYSYYSSSHLGTTYSLMFLRTLYEDDLDYRLRKIKSNLMARKFNDDSVLVIPQEGLAVKYFYTEFSQLKKDYTNLYKCHKALADEYCKLKRYTIGRKNLSEEYEKNLNTYNQELRTYHSSMAGFNKKFNRIKVFCKHQTKWTRKELKGYVYEKNIESDMFAIRSIYIRKHYSALLGVTNKQLSKCRRMKKSKERLKSKLTGISVQ